MSDNQQLPSTILELQLSEFKLTTRTCAALERMGFKSVGDVISFASDGGAGWWTAIQGFGVSALQDWNDCLNKHGVKVYYAIHPNSD